MSVTYANFNDDKKKAQAKKAWDDVLGKVGKANKYLNDLKTAVEKNHLASFPKDFEKVYITWFGALNLARITTVAENLHNLAKEMTSSDVTVAYLGGACAPGDYAYTTDAGAGDLDGVSLHLCGGFFTAPFYGENSQTGTISHELTHIVFNTNDHTYGKTNCKNLAINNPVNAIDNADNYEYLLEEFMN